MNGVRLPWPPFAHAVGATMTDAAFADLLGVDRRTILRWRADGIPEHAADEACARVGLHPINVWPAEYERLGTRSFIIAAARWTANRLYQHARRLDRQGHDSTAVRRRIERLRREIDDLARSSSS